MTHIAALEESFGASPAKGFCAGAHYFQSMDCVIYLREDVSYRAIRVSKTLSVLLAPDQDRVVGVKIKGVTHLAERLFAVLEAAGHPVDERNRVRLRALLEMAFTSEDFAVDRMNEAEAQRRAALTQRAKAFLQSDQVPVQVDLPRLRLAA